MTKMLQCSDDDCCATTMMFSRLPPSCLGQWSFPADPEFSKREGKENLQRLLNKVIQLNGVHENHSLYDDGNINKKQLRS